MRSPGLLKIIAGLLGDRLKTRSGSKTPQTRSRFVGRLCHVRGPKAIAGDAALLRPAFSQFAGDAFGKYRNRDGTDVSASTK